MKKRSTSRIVKKVINGQYKRRVQEQDLVIADLQHQLEMAHKQIEVQKQEATMHKSENKMFKAREARFKKAKERSKNAKSK